MSAAWLLLAASALPAPAQPAEDRSLPAAAWAALQVKHHEIADFNRRCGRLDPIKDADERWADPCRTLAAADLAGLLLDKDVPREGVRIVGARVADALDLTAAEIEHEVSITGSRLDGGVGLSRAVLDGRLMLDGTRIGGLFDGRRLRAKSDLLIRYGADAQRQIVLVDARIDGNLDLEGSHFEKPLNADRVVVAGSLFMNNHARFDSDIFIHYAAIGGNLELETSAFGAGVKAEGLKVSHHLFMVNATFKQAVIIPYAHISGNLDLSGGSFTRIDLGEAAIGQTLILRG
ncbi:MAG TPA: hypothetical protein VGF07_08590, partial [Stellaceae bacterium]